VRSMQTRSAHAVARTPHPAAAAAAAQCASAPLSQQPCQRGRVMSEAGYMAVYMCVAMTTTARQAASAGLRRILLVPLCHLPSGSEMQASLGAPGLEASDWAP